jgi:hypothetical protein
MGQRMLSSCFHVPQKNTPRFVIFHNRFKQELHALRARRAIIAATLTDTRTDHYSTYSEFYLPLYYCLP